MIRLGRGLTILMVSKKASTVHNSGPSSLAEHIMVRKNGKEELSTVVCDESFLVVANNVV